MADNSTASPDALDPPPIVITPEMTDAQLPQFLLLMCATFSAAFLIWRLAHVLNLRFRHIACLHNPYQLYFALPHHLKASFKRHLLYAPIFSKRHNREFQLSSAINVGTLPTRLQGIVLLTYLATNIVFAVINIPWTKTMSQAAGDLRNRCGCLAVANMIPMVILAGRNNPLLHILGISYDTFNLFHRWLGRIVVLESIVHVMASFAVLSPQGQYVVAFQGIMYQKFYQGGLVAIVAGILILFLANSVVRHAFYETFKFLHIVLAIAFMGGIWYHLTTRGYDSINYLTPAILAWVTDRAARILRLFYYNAGKHHSKATVEALPGEACRVTVSLARPWRVKPGQHAYVYMPALSLLQCHPFTVAWTTETQDPKAGTLPANKHAYYHAPRTMSVSFLVRSCTGFTQKLYKKAAASPDGKLETTCLVEGPYSGVHPLHSYGTVFLVAGGVGITHQMPYLRELIIGYSNGTSATRKILLVWVVQSPEHLEWIRPWITEILGMEKRREILRILIFVSRPTSSKEIVSPSETVQMFPGRPNLNVLLGAEMERQVGAMAVTVCGPGALSDEVRLAVRNRSHMGTIDFVEESFTW